MGQPLSLPRSKSGRTVVVGAGKASAAFAQAFESRASMASLRVDDSLVICPHGTSLPTQQIILREAAHPIPDEASVKAASEIMKLAQGLGEDDTLIVLLSGGGSALMSLPHEGVTLSEKRALIDALLKSGASIEEINCVRKHISAIKGGGLARAAYPARVVTYSISDVVGDDPAVIASGPTVADPTTSARALEVLRTFNIEPSPSITALLIHAKSETAKPGDQAFDNASYHLVCTPHDALSAAHALAEEIRPDLNVHFLGDDLEGEAARVAEDHAARVRELQSMAGSHLLLSGGELTVTFDETTKNASPVGGPNQEYVLALLKALGSADNIWALAADTDGRDGNSDNAGALFEPGTFARTMALLPSLDDSLRSHTSGTFLEALGQTFVTGPTHTNVNDFRAILILNQDARTFKRS